MHVFAKYYSNTTELVQKQKAVPKYVNVKKSKHYNPCNLCYQELAILEGRLENYCDFS